MRSSPSWQFPLQSLLLFTVLIAFVWGLNLKPKVQSQQLLAFGHGLIETVMVERGFPLRFQQVKRSVKPNTGQELIESGWPDTAHEPRVTHWWWLAANIVCGLGFAILAAWFVSLPRSTYSEPEAGAT